MGNPWLDSEKAGAWLPDARPGNSKRPEQIEILLELLAVHDPARVLDLGCGIGDIDARVLDRLPETELVCLDASAGMLARAREALAPYGARATLIEADLEDTWAGETGTGFDAVLTSQTIHHLEAPAKRDLFERVFEVLAPGGLFLLCDKLRFEPGLWPLYVALWNQARDSAGFERVSPEQTVEDYLVREAEGGDLPDLLEEQLDWLRAAGFEPVDSYWRYADKAVFGGFKPA